MRVDAKDFKVGRVDALASLLIGIRADSAVDRDLIARLHMGENEIAYLPVEGVSGQEIRPFLPLAALAVMPEFVDSDCQDGLTRLLAKPTRRLRDVTGNDEEVSGNHRTILWLVTILKFIQQHPFDAQSRDAGERVDLASSAVLRDWMRLAPFRADSERRSHSVAHACRAGREWTYGLEFCIRSGMSRADAGRSRASVICWTGRGRDAALTRRRDARRPNGQRFYPLPRSPG